MVLIPTEALVCFAFMTGALVFGFLAHLVTSFLYERLILREYIKKDEGVD